MDCELVGRLLSMNQKRCWRHSKPSSGCVQQDGDWIISPTSINKGFHKTLQASRDVILIEITEKVPYWLLVDIYNVNQCQDDKRSLPLVNRHIHRTPSVLALSTIQTQPINPSGCKRNTWQTHKKLPPVLVETKGIKLWHAEPGLCNGKRTSEVRNSRYTCPGKLTVCPSPSILVVELKEPTVNVNQNCSLGPSFSLFCISAACSLLRSLFSSLSFFRQCRIARSMSLHVPKNFMTLCSWWHCFRRAISSLHSSVCRWGDKSGCMPS